MRRLVVRLAVLGVIVLLAVLGWRWVTRQKPVAVLVARVERGRVESSVANTRAGTVKACRRAKLAPLSSGRVVQLAVKRGDRVKRGDVLLRLWNDDVAAQLQLATTSVRGAQARAQEACLLAEWGQREAERQRSLQAEGIASSQLVDNASTEAAARAATCRSAKAAQDEARRSVAVAQAALDRLVLRAPFDGVIADFTAEEGEIATPSPPGIPTPPTFDLIETGCLYVLAALDEIDAPRVRVGLPARVTLDAFPGRPFPAHVRRVASYVTDIEKQSRTVDVEVAIDDPTSVPNLAPGYSADIEVLLDAHADALRVPTEAVQENNAVLVLDGRRLVRRTIKTGLMNWQYTEVMSGLAAGDRVVVSLDRAGVVDGAPAVEDERPSGAP